MSSRGISSPWYPSAEEKKILNREVLRKYQSRVVQSKEESLQDDLEDVNNWMSKLSERFRPYRVTRDQAQLFTRYQGKPMTVISLCQELSRDRNALQEKVAQAKGSIREIETSLDTDRSKRHAAITTSRSLEATRDFCQALSQIVDEYVKATWREYSGRAGSSQREQDSYNTPTGRSEQRSTAYRDVLN